MDEAQAKDYEKDLENFLEIEHDIESKLYNKIEDEEEECGEQACVDEIRSLNGIIKAYKKGRSEITCHSAINLINRYCTSLEHNVCGVLYPIYNSESTEENNIKYYRCSVRLPPNSVLNRAIEVWNFFS